MNPDDYVTAGKADLVEECYRLRGIIKDNRGKFERLQGVARKLRAERDGLRAALRSAREGDGGGGGSFESLLRTLGR